MITDVRLNNFQPIFDVASCFIERTDGKILLLLRQPHKSEGGKWGVPAGKVEESENPEQAIIREVAEETSLVIPTAPSFFGTYYVQFPEYDFVYHIFHQQVPNDSRVQISKKEHQEFRWVMPEDALAMDLIMHQDDCTKFFYFSADTSRHVTRLQH